MGIVNIKIRNFKSAKKVDYDLSKGKVNCLIGKNGVGKTTIERAIVYFYEIANNPYELKDVADKMNHALTFRACMENESIMYILTMT